MVTHVNKPKPKPVNASRLRNPNAKDNQSQTTLSHALYYRISNQTVPYLILIFF